MSDLSLLNQGLTPEQILDIWKKKYADPHDEQTQKAFEIMNDPNHQWRDKEQKEFAELKYRKLDTENIDNAILYNAMKKQAQDYKDLLAFLASIYDRWLNNVAYEGVQQKEMMQGQADMLNDIFAQIAVKLNEKV